MGLWLERESEQLCGLQGVFPTRTGYYLGVGVEGIPKLSFPSKGGN